ncbi:GAD-like domain-containing protein [Litorilituus sediminis]|uniref:DUF1851 domain-containing protein n=1 Tax=Litorilituus sediminis TaxID=718192 RepID=A0A4P6P662_9GAMM|nr:GAD-like domain-containing protein [Litorilituus sediminis]QBG34927.1 DUF1851 domain-containing protein [Litorilituus sediminis]
MAVNFEVDEELECFLDEFYLPRERNIVPVDIINKYKNKLPNRLLEYWQEFGFSGFNDGLFWLVNPEHYEDVLDAWLDDTDIIENDSYFVIARDAFGDLYLWGQQTGYQYKVSPRNGWIIQQEGDCQEILNGNENEALMFFFGCQVAEYVNIKDNNNKPLFEQCKLIHQPLAYDEMYAFEPALFLGGEAKLENTTKVNIFAHLTMLASFGHKELLDKDGLIQKAFG